jgi:hypothetical protein
MKEGNGLAQLWLGISKLRLLRGILEMRKCPLYTEEYEMHIVLKCVKIRRGKQNFEY